MEGGNRRLAFVYLPPNTPFNSNADYKAFCESKGFDQNQFRDSREYLEGTGMVNSAAYYRPAACVYLGSGNGGANGLTGFQNYGLPTCLAFRVRDRGCGDLGGNFNTGQNTTDKLVISGPNQMSYVANGFASGSDYGQVKPASFSNEGVIVCQTKN